MQNILVIILPALCSLFFYNYAFNRNYFMLVEGRSYIAQAVQVLDGQGFLNWLFTVDLHSFITQRITNKLFYLLNSSVCGIQYDCHNFFQIILVSLTALLFGIFLIQIRLPKFYYFLLPFFWVFSHSVLHAIHWQATGLEKLLGFFTILYLVTFIYFMRKTSNWLNVAISNLILSLILLLALSSKEHSALLYPISILLAGVFVVNGEWKLRDVLKKILVPSIIALIHCFFFLKFIVIPFLLPKTAGIYDGSIVSNLFMFMGFAFNSYDNYEYFNPLVTYGIWLSFIFLIFIELFICYHKKSKPSYDFLLMIWSGLSSLGFLAAMSRLHYQNRYYLLVPGFFLFILLFLEMKLWIFYIIELVATLIKKKIKVYQSTILLLIMCGYGLWHIKAFSLFYSSDFEPLTRQSRNFVNERANIEKIIQNPIEKTLYLVSEVHGRIASVIHTEFPPEAPRYVAAFWFQNRDYINGKQTEHVKFLDRKDFETLSSRSADSYYIIFDRELNVEQVDLESSTIFKRVN